MHEIRPEPQDELPGKAREVPLLLAVLLLAVLLLARCRSWWLWCSVVARVWKRHGVTSVTLPLMGRLGFMADLGLAWNGIQGRLPPTGETGANKARRRPPAGDRTDSSGASWTRSVRLADFQRHHEQDDDELMD